MSIHLTRRHVLAGAGALALSGTTIGRSFAQQSGGTLNVVSNEPSSLVLALSTQGPTQLIGGKMYESLLSFDFNLTPQPCLAKSWSVSPDGMEYEFKLQENVTWHDGRPFTADDVVFTTQVMLPETHTRARNNFDNVAEFHAPDPHTVIFKMKHPFAPFLGAFQVASAPMMPKHIYEGTDFRNNPANANPVGTGPFKFSEWRRGSHIHLVRNDAYWKQDRPYLDEIYFKIIPDVASRTLAIESGELDVVTSDDIELFDVARLQANPDIVRVDQGSEIFGEIGWIELNHRVKPLDDKRFRQALMYALDRDFIVENIWYGIVKPATGPINSSTKYYDPSLKGYPYDLEKAKSLLDEMGLEANASGTRASLKLLQSPYGGAWNRLAEYVKQQMAQIGVEIVIESTDMGAFAQRVSNWDYEMTFNRLLQFGDPALGVARSYVSTNIRKGIMFSNTMGYSNPRVDELFEQAQQTVDEDERTRMYKEVQEILVDEVPVAWLTEGRRVTFHNKRVNDLITTSTGTYDSFDSAWISA